MPGEVGSAAWIAASFVAALFLAMIPLPVTLEAWRPAFVAMLVIYWSLLTPHRVGVATAWVAGFALDGFSGSILGQHAFGFAMVAYICQTVYQRLRRLHQVRQASFVFVLVGLAGLFSYWVDSLAARSVADFDFLKEALVSALLWPAFYAVMERYRWRCHVQ